MQLNIKRLSETAVLPQYAHPGDAGLDLVAIEVQTLLPGESGLIRTGIALELPDGIEAQVRPRSGLALKHQVTVLNAPGTIDAGYRGELCVILINHGKSPFQVEPGMRIAQLVVAPVLRVQTQWTETFSAETTRSAQGFGSTGLQ
ncbi:MAG: dUTP diphosphatase [Thermosynechococcaceae cyanobacterium]